MNFEDAVECIRMILNLRFNEHDNYHRSSCFKKGCECRANLPMMMWKETTIDFDIKNSIPWLSINGCTSSRCSLQVNPRRLQGDQFLNVHNPAASFVFSCNTNIQIGQVDHMYYNTLYGSKANQKEETRSFMNVSNALAGRIHKKIQEDQTDPQLNMTTSKNSNSKSAPDFVEGLCRLLSGITANLSSTVVSAPLGHALIVKGSRFQFSHDSSPLLL